MKEKNIDSLKRKFFILTLVPFIAIILLSLMGLDQKIAEFKNRNAFSKSIEYSKIATDLINSLQKERGLSILYQNSKFAQESLKDRRAKSSNAYKALIRAIADKNLCIGSKQKCADIIAQFEKLKLLRDRVDKGLITESETLREYSHIISKLIDSTSILIDLSTSTSLKATSESFISLLYLSDAVGIERALTTLLLNSSDLTSDLKMALYKTFAKKELLTKKLRKVESPEIQAILQNSIDPLIAQKIKNIENSIAFENSVQEVGPKEWWNLLTKYIDGVTLSGQKVLQKLLIKKEQATKEALYELILNFLLWVVSLIALIYASKVLLNILKEYSKQIELTQERESYYRALAEILENLSHQNSKESLLQSLCESVVSLEKFHNCFVFSFEADRAYTLASNNISLLDIDSLFKNREFTELLKKSISNLKQNRYLTTKTGIENLSDCIGDRSIAIFSILSSDDNELLLAICINDDAVSDNYLYKLVDKMCQVAKFAIKKAELEKSEEANKKELALMAVAFNSQEAITITDPAGKIIKINEAFTKITGYSEKETLGKTPSLLKSGLHDKEFYTSMWDSIRKEGVWRGEIYNKRKSGEIYPEMLSISSVKDEEGNTTNYVAHFFDITELKRAQSRAEYMAEHDPLTDLLNRDRIYKELKRIWKKYKQNGEYGAFIFIDLDNFKQINDTYGHHIGDEVLKKTAILLKNFAHEKDLIGRIGGDEFVFIMNDLGFRKSEAIKKVSILLEKIEHSLVRDFTIDEIELDVSFSIGIKIFPDKESSAQEIPIDADIAMYHAKRNGKNQHKFFDEYLDKESKSFLILKNELKKAIKNSEFVMHYQPKVSLKDNKIGGFEALVRWQHPKKGLLFPGDFIDATTSNELGWELTKVVVQNVAEQIGYWQKRYSGYNLPIAINLSGELFNRKSFHSEIIDLVTSQTCELTLLEFEIVEDTLMNNLDTAIDVIGKLKRLGIKFAIDDFGTGYSSLSYLKKLPVDTLKIDREFILNISDENNSSVVDMIIGTAHIFGMNCIAEGVENEETKEHLKSRGCDMYQGYLFSKPLPPKDIENRWLNNIFPSQNETI